MSKTTLDDLRGLDTPQVLAALKAGILEAEAGVFKTCCSVVILEERGVDLPKLPDVYRYAREIAEGRLTVKAAWNLTSLLGAVRAVLPLPPALQDEIAEGKRIKIAVRGADGRIRFEDKTIYQMSPEQMKLSFGEDGITPAEEQGEWLLKAPRAAVERASKPVIKIDADSGELIISRGGHFTPDDLRDALCQLGYKLDPIYRNHKVRPVKVV